MSVTPITAPNSSDPGDETERRYAYQHAYGVILWAAAYRGDRDYTALWCEQHEDFLGQVAERQFDAFQIKTRIAELGYWKLSDEALYESIKRFAKLDEQFPGQIRTFYFVSNCQCSDSQAQDREHLSPALVLPRFGEIPLCPWCEKSLALLIEKTGLTREALVAVLKRTKIVLGPPDASITAEIIANHLPAVNGQHHCTRPQLESLYQRMAGQVRSASALLTQDPARHYSVVNGRLEENSQLRAKRIPVRDLESHLEFLQLLSSHTSNSATGRRGPAATTGVQMALLIARYKAETEKDRKMKEMVAQLREWHDRPRGDVIGLEEKLRRGGRLDLVDFAIVAKEKFARHMMRHENSPAAQEIYAVLLAHVWVIFGDLVYPRIVEKAPPDVIGKILVDEVYPRVDALLQENPLGLDLAQIKGMLYWLTGNCHLKWAPDANLQPSV